MKQSDMKKAVEVALQQYPGKPGPTPRQVFEVVKKLFPYEVADEMQAKAEEAGISELRRYMKRELDPPEGNGEEETNQLLLKFIPGEKVPLNMVYQDDRHETHVIRTADAGLEQWEYKHRELHGFQKSVNRRVAQFDLQFDFLKPHLEGGLASTSAVCEELYRREKEKNSRETTNQSQPSA